MYEELGYKSSTSKYKKSNSNIDISKDIELTFWYVVFFTWINDDTVRNALTIRKYLETTHGPEQRK